MSVLFHAPGLLRPSHLWMLRMVEQLGSDISILAVSSSGRRYRAPSKIVRIRAGTPVWWRRALARVRILPSPWPNDHLVRLADDSSVSCVLLNYLTYALRFGQALPRISKPMFVHCHGYDVTWDLRSPDGKERVHADDYVERVLGLPPRVHFIANSKETRRRLESIGIIPERISMKYFGVEVPSAPPVRELTRPACRVLYLGRLIECKGPDLTIEAFDRACSLGFRGGLTIAGDGPMRETCERLRASSAYGDRIEMLGAVDRPTGERLRSQADIFTAHNCLGVRSRQAEAFGVNLAEAMAAALPVVTGRSGGVPEIVDDGVHGILFEPGDVEAHADALLRLEGDGELRTRVGRQAWDHARERFSIERESSELRRILGLS